MDDYLDAAAQTLQRLTGMTRAHATRIAEALSLDARQAVHEVAERARQEIEKIIAVDAEHRAIETSGS